MYIYYTQTKKFVMKKQTTIERLRRFCLYKTNKSKRAFTKTIEYILNTYETLKFNEVLKILS